MKKIIMFILCMLCLFGTASVNAEELNTPSNEGGTSNLLPGENTSESNDPNEGSDPETPVDDEESDEENVINVLEQEETKQEETVVTPSTENKTDVVVNNANTEKKESYSYVSNNTEKKEVIVKISNVEKETGKALVGANLQILDKDGKVVQEWKSEKKEYIIKDLKKGSYTLVVKKQVEGYESEKDKIEFDIDYSENELNLQIESSKIIKTPNKLTSETIMLLSIAMVDIAILIWIIIYVKKNKVKE